MVPIAVNIPTAKRSESPGRMGNIAHSVKRINATPHKAQFPRDVMMISGSSQLGSSSGIRMAKLT
jgi:hypothetical protein